jgi:hypothetical protein
MTFREIAEAIRSGKMVLDFAGHRVNVTQEAFLKNYDELVALSKGKNDGKWINRKGEPVEKVDAQMRDHYQRQLDIEYNQEEWLLLVGGYCFGCGEDLQWTLTGNKLQLRGHYEEIPGSMAGDFVNYPADYVCPFVKPQPTQGQIKITSCLVFANFFRDFDDSPKEHEHSREWSLSSLAGRKRITEHKAGLNVAFGGMGNMSIGIYINQTKDSIIVGPAFHPAEGENFDTEEEYREAVSKPTFPGYRLLDKICLDVWRWEATDLDTIGPNNYDKLVEDHKYRGLVKIEVPHGIWEFRHFYDTRTHANKSLYAELKLAGDKGWQ